MNKTDQPALLPPGKHVCDLAKTFDIAVRPFLPDARRTDLWERFKALLLRLRRLGLEGATVWIGGSFLTERTYPGDLDMMVWLPDVMIDGLSDEAFEELNDIRTSTPVILNIYGVDLYFAPPDPINLQNWDRKLGTCHDDTTPKGYIEIVL